MENFSSKAVFSSKVFLLANTHLIVVVILAHLDRRFASLLIPRIMSNSLFPFLCVIYSDHKNEFFTHETFFSWRSTDSRRVPNKDNPQISFLLATFTTLKDTEESCSNFNFYPFLLLSECTHFSSRVWGSFNPLEFSLVSLRGFFFTGRLSSISPFSRRSSSRSWRFHCCN